LTAFDEYAAQVVERAPNPPRTVSKLSLLGRMYAGSASRWLVGVGLLLGVPATLAFVVSVGETWLRVLGALFCALFTVLMVAAPAIGALRLSRALASGIRIEGEIVSAEWSYRPATVDAATNGFTVGSRRVLHPSGEFVERFESDSKWARDLTPGKRVALLADAGRPRVLFDLGPLPEP
jgi:hypothetical protein